MLKQRQAKPAASLLWQTVLKAKLCCGIVVWVSLVLPVCSTSQQLLLLHVHIPVTHLIFFNLWTLSFPSVAITTTNCSCEAVVLRRYLFAYLVYMYTTLAHLACLIYNENLNILISTCDGFLDLNILKYLNSGEEKQSC